MLATTPSHTQRLQHAFDRSVTDLRRAIDSLGDSDRRRAQAIATWFDGFAVEQRAHLQSVAELVIPTIARRREQQADELAEIVADHHCAVDEAIDDLSVALARLASRVQPWAFNHDRAIDAVHRLEAATHRSNAAHPGPSRRLRLPLARVLPPPRGARADPRRGAAPHADHVVALPAPVRPAGRGGVRSGHAPPPRRRLRPPDDHPDPPAGAGGSHPPPRHRLTAST